MNKKILYKLLLIFALLACTLLISNTKSFASVEVPSDIYNSSYIESSNDPLQAIHEIIDNNSDEIGFTSSELLQYQVVLKGLRNDGTYVYYLFCSDVNFYYIPDNTNPTALKILFDKTSGETSYYYYYCLVFSTAFFSPYDEFISTTSRQLNLGGFGQVSYSIYDTNFDLYSNTGELVFQQPPQVMEQVGTLAPIVEEMETKKTLAEVVGILPIILVVVVGLLAMRKAIAFLMRTLKQG